jgi:hypothetical protein
VVFGVRTVYILFVFIAGQNNVKVLKH